MSAALSLNSSIETLAPFRRSSAQHDAIPAKISGEIPAWLRGEVVRTCPAVFETKEWHARHWFDGLGMIYAFRIGDDAVDFRSRLLDSNSAREAAGGKVNLASFGTPTTRSLWRRIFEPVPRITDNANVNVLKLGDELVAMTESDRQLVIDPVTLASAGEVTYAKDSLRGAIMSAHPHYDFGRVRVVNLATKLGSGGTISVYEHGPKARERKVVGSWRTSRVPYVHSFGLTPQNAIIVAHPFSVAPVKMLWSERGFVDHFDWQPSEGTRLVVMDRTTGRTREHVADPFFVFHTVNAFETDGAAVLDLLAYPSADIVALLSVDRLTAGLPDLRPSLLRLTMRPGVERASIEKLSDRGFEFPATNYKRVNGRAYRFAWGASDGPRADKAYTSEVVKIDLTTGASTSFSDDDHIFGEPIFVAQPNGMNEDDGVLVTVGSSKSNTTSVLAIIDAKTMALVASAEVPSSIPLGFHGSFQREGR
jgi:carotenoid cleavage dioxygenase-like enzyme